MGLTFKEVESLNKLLRKEERSAGLPYKNLNGGFAKAEVYDYDEDTIDVELKYGVQSNSESNVYSETLKIDRQTMQWAD